MQALGKTGVMRDAAIDRQGAVLSSCGGGVGNSWRHKRDATMIGKSCHRQAPHPSLRTQTGNNMCHNLRHRVGGRNKPPIAIASHAV